MQFWEINLSCGQISNDVTPKIFSFKQDFFPSTAFSLLYGLFFFFIKHQ
jgi:hypothetical protein